MSCDLQEYEELIGKIAMQKNKTDCKKTKPVFNPIFLYDKKKIIDFPSISGKSVEYVLAEFEKCKYTSLSAEY